MCIDPDAGNDIEYFSDSDWATDRITRRSVSAALIQVEGCTLHGQCRGQDTIATSSTQAEIISASDGIKEALLAQYLLHFLGLGFRMIRLKLDSSGAVSFTHRQGIGNIKHLAVRHLWLQELVEKSLVRVQKIPRDVNVADMMTHPPSAKELSVFCPLVGLFPVDFMENPLQSVVEALIPRGKSVPISTRALTQGLLLVSALGRAKAELVEIPLSFAAVEADRISLSFSLEQIVFAVVLMVSMFWLLLFRVCRHRSVSTASVVKHSLKLSTSEVLWQSKTGRKLHRSRSCRSLKSSDPTSVVEAEVCKFCCNV
jgi:hypothetical protein